jgi:hypothetical protein
MATKQRLLREFVAKKNVILATYEPNICIPFEFLNEFVKIFERYFEQNYIQINGVAITNEHIIIDLTQIFDAYGIKLQDFFPCCKS